VAVTAGVLHPRSSRRSQANRRGCRACKAHRYFNSFIALVFFLASDYQLITFTVSKLSPPPEPYDPEADPVMKATLETIRIVEEVVNKLLNKAAEFFLNED
jgi:hypothetical protein